jgi:hypothetical protein
MKTFSVKQIFEEQINQLWNSDKHREINFLNRGYAIQNNIELDSLLFIGINPAYKNNDPNQSSHFYDVALEGAVYQYFKKFQDISKKTNLKWTHIDLLFIRETNQKNIEAIVKTQTGWDFCQKQLEISKQIIQETKPKIIVVSNAYARRLFGIYFKCSFDNNIGTFRIIENEFLNNTPVFFTSMLTGQRALDLGSYERLIWHINFVKDK